MATGRSIDVNSTAWSLRLSTTRDTATIETGGHRIVVAPAFVRVDGNRPTPIDAAAKTVTIEATKDAIVLTADGRAQRIWKR